MTLYSSNRKTQSNNEYECNATFKQQLSEIVEVLEAILSNDAKI